MLTQYARLTLAQKVREEQYGGDVIVSKDLFRYLMSEILKSVPLDESFYLRTNPDVSEAVARGTISSAREHFVRFGYFEDRMPRHIVVDADYYIASNPDVAEAIASGQLGSPQEHFERYGYREGRLPSADWAIGKS
jgi:hypothetical protein